MKRRTHLPNNKITKRNTPGTDRFKREGAWRVKETKVGTHNHKRNKK